MKLLNKIKNAKKTKTLKKAIKRVPNAEPRKLNLIKPQKEMSRQSQAIAVEESKFYTGPQGLEPKRAPITWEIPTSYGRDEIIIQVRDPWWVHSYWELTQSTLDKLRYELGDAFNSAKRVLRVYDVSFINFDGTNAHHYFDIEITHYANNWYIDTQGPGRSWCVDLGLKLSDGKFITIVRSNVVTMPLDGPSWQTDEEWMIPDDLFARLYGLGIGGGSSAGIKKLWKERLKRQFASGAFASGGFSPVKKEKKRGFWLVVNTELIVYGATEPNAKVTVQGRPINLRADGTFTLRFALPDGKQVIPVKAVSADKVDERVITPIVTKETK
jgi:hypothetical protein